MHWIDWSVLVGVLDLGHLRRAQADARQPRDRRLFPREPIHSLVGRRPLRHGDAAQRHHDDRHDRSGLQRRAPLHPVLLRAAAGDDRPVRSRWCRSSTTRGVYTAYEYLERRFDAKTRSFTSLLFLISRGMQCGAVVSAPAVVLSLVLGWDLTLTALAITAPAVIYTMFGGVQAVTWTDVKIMVLIVFGMLAVVAAAILGFPVGCRRGRRLQHRCSDGTPADVRLLVRSDQPVHVLVGDDRRAVSLLLGTSAPTRARSSGTSPRGPWTRRATRC